MCDSNSRKQSEKYYADMKFSLITTKYPGNYDILPLKSFFLVIGQILNIKSYY